VTETEHERVRRVIAERIEIVDYDAQWPERFEAEKRHLEACLPGDVVLRIEHFGSTAVPGLAAKPIIDILVQVSDFQAMRERVVPVLEAQGYEYFWRPTLGDDTPPYYGWFIKRDPLSGKRTHHIHMVEAGLTEHWDRLQFRDHLIAHPETAQRYAEVKRAASAEHPNDRAAYTRAKSEFIAEIMQHLAGPSG